MSTLATRAKASGSVKWLRAAIAAAFVACFAFLTLGGASAQQAFAATAENDITISIVGTDGQTEETKYTVTADQLDQLAVTDGEAVAQFYKGGKWTVLYSTNYVPLESVLDQAGVTAGVNDTINFGASDGINKKWTGATLSELEAGQFYPNFDASTSTVGDGGYTVPPALALTYATGTGSTPAEALENAKAAAQETTSCPRSFMGVLSDGTVGGNRLWSGVTDIQVSRAVEANVVSADGSNISVAGGLTYAQLSNIAVTDGEAVAQYYKGGKWTVLYSTNYAPLTDYLDAVGVTADTYDVINFGASDGINGKWQGATLSELEAGQFYPNYEADTSAAGGGGYTVPPALALTYATGTGSTPAEALENAKAAAQETTGCPRSFMGVLSDGTVGGNRLWSGVTFVQIAQKTCTASYQTNGGSEIGTQKVEYGTTLAQPAAPTRDGYTFGGWYTDKALTSAYDFNTAVTGNIALYAKWTKNAVTSVPSQKVTGLAIGKSATAGSGASKAIYKATGASTVTYVVSKASTKTITVPATVKINGKTYKVTNVASNAFKGKKATKINLNKYVTTVTAKMFNGAKKVKTIVLGAKVKKIAAKAFKSNSALKTLTVKTKKLTKKSVKNSLKSSKVKTVKVNVGKTSVDKKYVKKYAKIFTKANAGKKVTVKR